MTHEVSEDHTAQYKEELPPNAGQVASKGLIASAASESLSIQHLGKGVGLGSSGWEGGVLLGFVVRAASPIVSVSALV